jgi:hypothetical protein
MIGQKIAVDVVIGLYQFYWISKPLGTWPSTSWQITTMMRLCRLRKMWSSMVSLRVT